MHWYICKFVTQWEVLGLLPKLHHMRFKTIKSWVPTLYFDSNRLKDSCCFLENRSNSSSIILVPKCLLIIPSMPALRCFVNAWPLRLSTLAPGCVISILSMLKHPFVSTSCVISLGEATYTGKLKVFTWASLINPCKDKSRYFGLEILKLLPILLQKAYNLTK